MYSSVLRCYKIFLDLGEEIQRTGKIGGYHLNPLLISELQSWLETGVETADVWSSGQNII